MFKSLPWSLIVLVALAAGCEKEKPAAVPVVPVVTVSQPIRRMSQECIEATGNISADKTVQLCSQVRGYLDNTLFKAGDRVKAGQLLFQIDPRPFQANVDVAKADLAVAAAQLALAEAKLSRMEAALKANSISEVQVIEQRADRDKAKADVERCKASLESANLQLDYTRITAPFDGRLDVDNPKKGALIDPQTTVMTTITDDSIVYAYFNVSEYDLLRVRKANRSSPQVASGKVPPIPVYVGLAGETGYPHEGVLDYVAPQVDRATGTIQVRARFENADRELLGGYFVRVRMPVTAPKEYLMVAERALGQDQGQRYALVVSGKNIVEYRPVELGPLEAGLCAVEAGLSADDWVIVNGLQRVRPGVQVAPQRVSMESVVRPISGPPPSSGPAGSSTTKVAK
jgi:RND family efflux transporter MFP subunit